MFFIELVHQMRVSDQQQDEAEDGTLLGHPKSEGAPPTEYSSSCSLNRIPHPKDTKNQTMRSFPTRAKLAFQYEVEEEFSLSMAIVRESWRRDSKKGKK